MIIYTIGFTKKTAKEFFSILIDNHVEVLIDIRLNNSSQLAGFTKMNDLAYFLNAIGKINYIHYPDFAPTKEILKNYQNNDISWEQYKIDFEELLSQRNCMKDFSKKVRKFTSLCLLCSEEKPIQCHRSLVANYLKTHIKDSVIKDL